MGQDYILEIKDMNQDFALGQKSNRILKNVSVQIPQGSFTIIYGPSGSGKSTLLNALMGLQKPSTGQVFFKGKDLYTGSKDDLAFYRNKNISTVYQTNYWVKSLSVLENVALPLYFQDVEFKEARARALEQLKALQMDRHSDTLPTFLSGGEQQRIAMARALVTNGELIVADEPTGNLDTLNGDMIIRLLKDSQRKLGKTVILVTHELEYLTFGDHLFHIEDGAVTSIVGKDIEDATKDMFSHVQARIRMLKEMS